MKSILLLTTLMGVVTLAGCSANQSSQIAVSPVPSINSADIMSRQFTFSEADLRPVANSSRPSAVIIFDKGINARKLNKALCNGFVKLQTTDEAEASTSVAIENQVVTKVPVTKEIDQNEVDCDEILKVYDYNLASQQLSQLNAALTKSTGPFIAVYNPNSTKIDQLIDLRGTSAKDLEKFGENWSSIFTEANSKYIATKQTNQKFEIFSFIKTFFKGTVCVTDPNLVYIFNEPAGKIVDIVCKSQLTA